MSYETFRLIFAIIPMVAFGLLSGFCMVFAMLQICELNRDIGSDKQEKNNVNNTTTH